MQERRKLLAMVGRDRQLREPEGGWKSLRQIKTASQRTRADAQVRNRADAQTSKGASSLSDYQARQHRALPHGPGQGLGR